ncbi:5-formyltetrahydrofolate cyclo-ligase [Gryllotalpicola ginsengisoli]|uniref:5-formyltetrahydrofolate cyclo-ligase n=1 Tax=Gryllotalpicola ginsengisoli TaxID=444608 RepID=UPI0003B40AFA|nr:5-formyltetrahydrofolate cyclo-ligase [Gryllotalpicola ginsengisoli]
MPGDEISNRKRALRAELRERRRNRPGPARERDEVGLTERLKELVTRLGVSSLSAYLSSTTEPNVRPFLNWARENGIRTLLPISRQDGLLDWTTGDGESETESFLGWPEATGELLGPMAINDVDVILVPAAAVDRSGMRLGWGRGYFDKMLGSMGKCPPVFAVLFDEELVDDVPRERHDVPVDGVVTPTRIVCLSQRAQGLGLDSEAAARPTDATT